MYKGVCKHCGSRDQQYYEPDDENGFRRLACFICGYTDHYIGHGGKRQLPLPLERKEALR